jgi:hypothetical protein
MEFNSTSKTYNLEQINTILFAGLDYPIPDETINLLNYLTEQIGSSSFIKNKVFHKREQKQEIMLCDPVSNYKIDKKKRKGNKGMEVGNEDWDSIRSFHTTKIEQKTGLDAIIDKLRLTLSKLTKDKFQIIKEQIIAGINEIMEMETNTDILTDKIGNMIYDIGLNNKLLSKMYADFFTELLNIYDWLRPIISSKLNTYLDLFENMVYFDPDKDYDKFCDMNAINERRKMATQMFVNLSLNGVISKVTIYELLVSLLKMMFNLLNQPDKKYEVDEITENIAILFNKDIIECVEKNNFDKDKHMINDLRIVDLIKSFANSKAKDYKSLSNKAIFKYMDLIEM